MSGLSAAYSLRSRNVLALESGDRPGGRVRSQAAGDYWLNFDAHMFGGPETPIGRLLSELNVPAAPINGRLMGIAYGGKRLLRYPAESYPLLLPFSLRERFAMVRMGVKLRYGSGRFLAHMKRCETDDANQPVEEAEGLGHVAMILLVTAETLPPGPVPPARPPGPARAQRIPNRAERHASGKH